MEKYHVKILPAKRTRQLKPPSLKVDKISPKLKYSPFTGHGHVTHCKKSEESDLPFTRYRDFKIEQSDWSREGVKWAQN